MDINDKQVPELTREIYLALLEAIRTKDWAGVQILFMLAKELKFNRPGVE